MRSLEAEVAALKAQLDDVKANFNERLKQALYDRASDRHDRLEELQDRVHDLEGERDRLRGALEAGLACCSEHRDDYDRGFACGCWVDDARAALAGT